MPIPKIRSFSIFPILLCLFLLIPSCSSKYDYKHLISFHNYIWLKSNPLQFDLEVESPNSIYDMVVSLRHPTLFPYESIPLKVKIIMPGGQSSEEKFQLEVKDSEGKFLGDGMGDLWDLDRPLLKLDAKKVGKYTFIFTHNLEKDELILIQEFGLKALKVEN